MQGETDATGLTTAATGLIETLAGELTGDQRFRALMALSAMRMAERERALSAQLLEAERDVLAIAGAADAAALRDQLRALNAPLDGTLYQALLKDAIIRTAVTKPGALTAEERALAGLPD